MRSQAQPPVQNDPALTARIGAIINRPEFRHALATHRFSSRYSATSVVAEQRSAPATEMVKVVLKVSQNMHASALPLPLLIGALYGTNG